MCPKGPEVWNLRSPIAPFLVTGVCQIDYKAMKLVEDESLWCLTTWSFGISWWMVNNNKSCDVKISTRFYQKISKVAFYLYLLVFNV